MRNVDNLRLPADVFCQWEPVIPQLWRDMDKWKIPYTISNLESVLDVFYLGPMWGMGERAVSLLFVICKSPFSTSALITHTHQGNVAHNNISLLLCSVYQLFTYCLVSHSQGVRAKHSPGSSYRFYSTGRKILVWTGGVCSNEGALEYRQPHCIIA